LSQHTDAHRPFVDSLTTWSSVLATFMVAKKVLENWLYWILINTISIFLFIERGLDQTAVMFSLYLLLSVLGYMTWLKSYANQNQTSS
jgi:nicotinamide mononucleotide transporter